VERHFGFAPGSSLAGFATVVLQPAAVSSHVFYERAPQDKGVGANAPEAFYTVEQQWL
jgi:hypothetical protein